MIRLAEEIEQCRYKIDVTDWLLNGFAPCLTWQPDQERNARGLFEHCFFPKEMMRAQAVAVVARVHDNRVLSQTESLKAGEDAADALVNQRNEPEVALFNAAIFFRCDPKEQLSGQALPVQNRFGLLPFSHQTITQRNMFAFRKRRRHIEVHIIQRMLVIERTVVRRMWLYKANDQNERIALMYFDKVACAFLEEF